ncbi:MAG: hypothetical protein K0R28_2707 [Paenibacillus sp.]|nr:hypothetical protein [Paenibacillus sp.]
MYWNKILLVAILTWAVPTIEETVTADRLKAAEKAVERLQTESNGTLTIEWNEITGTPGMLSGYLTKPSNHSPQWIAIDF